MARKKSLDQGPVLRQQILDNASRLFHDRGFAGTSIRDIAEAVGISSSTMYHHFTNKQEVLSAIITKFMDDFNVATIPVLADETLSVTDRLCAVIRIHVEMSDDRRHELLVGNPVKFALDAEQARRLVNQQWEYNHAVRSLMETGCREGVLEVEDAELATLALLDMLNGIREWFREDDRLTRDQIIWHYTRLALRLLGSSSTPTDGYPKVPELEPGIPAAVR
jgi:AcrR family transcriptional regulator